MAIIVLMTFITPNHTNHSHSFILVGAPEKNLIRTAMALIEKESCVRFERLYDGHEEKDYIYIQPGYGCASTIGHNEGRQAVYLHKIVSRTGRERERNV
jgi:Astacin (Peptidase family M12A)